MRRNIPRAQVPLIYSCICVVENPLRQQPLNVETFRPGTRSYDRREVAEQRVWASLGDI